jgi:Icc-related predicted phosphoesterase
MAFNILHISDTHGFHNEFPKETFKDIDMIIHSGDCSNSRYLQHSILEITNFLNWYEMIDVKYKIFVAGNHDTAIERKSITGADIIMRDIIYLENESIEIEGLKIWGSPITPTFGEWSFMKARDKTHEVWKKIPNDTDIAIVHGPPKGIRDLSHNREGQLEFCGDLSLRKRIDEVRPRLMCFGHIHDSVGCHNQGVSTFQQRKTIFSNASCVTDGRFDLGLTSFGNIFQI